VLRRPIETTRITGQVSRKAFFSNTFFGIDKMVSAFKDLLGSKRLLTMFFAHLANAKAGTKSLGELLKAVKPPRVAHFSKVPRI
jgi:hypothetical protein